MTSWIRMSELCVRLNRAESTLLLWHRMYTPWLPRQRDDEEGVYVYPLEAYDEVAELTAGSRHPSDVRRELRRRHGGEDVDLERMGGTLTHLQRLEDRLEEMYRDLAERLADVRSELDALERRLDRP